MARAGGVDILLVEDNRDHAELTLKALAGDNAVHQVYWVKDGQEALDFLHHRDRWADAASAPRPGLILLDIHLPKVSGHEVLRHVKGDEAFRSIPVVMLTTSDRTDEVAATYHAGANNFVTKPLKFAEFIEQIKLLKRYWTLASQLPASKPSPLPGAAPPLPGTPHVLVIEDPQDSRDRMQQVIEHAGMRVTAVASADQALAVAESAAVDLVVTDVSLMRGGRDGVWLLNRLLERWPDLPVVAITGRTERAHELIEMGFASVMIKPIAVVDDIVNVMRGVMRRSR